MAAVDIYGGSIADSFDNVDYAVVGEGYHPEVSTSSLLTLQCMLIRPEGAHDEHARHRADQ